MQTSPIEVQKALKNIDYPVNKKQLIEHAKKHDASSKVIEAPKTFQKRSTPMLQMSARNSKENNYFRVSKALNGEPIKKLPLDPNKRGG